ncbi:ABC transporter substrate-binding protein [Paenibacillus allorhizosphaerae]|uniref:Extracellular solute-binding protein n=1 Tax=Paenibacillus allorhizosphaerae TaxID=2849866 RepID=A0ABM8VNZ2_9BACL|nr:extracellular solute-binding protein [Paenibacillus allorhizosphaerae]CAG7652206.1 hypothetical protein PAECIP111802_05163 [Paenibacillus allorhizosphaerae]
MVVAFTGYKKAAMLASLTVLIGASAGCSGGSGTNGPANPGSSAKEAAPPSNEPVEITIRTGTADEEFNRTVREPLKKKFPNVTITKVGYDQKLQELIAANKLPDMMQQAYTNMDEIIDIDYAMNLDEMVKKYNVDLNRFNPDIVKVIRSASVGKNELLLYPFLVQPFVLHYNKGIFDKFGVEYPKAGNTWDDLIELSKKLSRSQDGVNYRGLDAGLSVNRMQLQLSLPYVDAKTGKSLVGSHPGWTRFFQTYQAVYSVPGNFPEGAKYGDGSKAFLETKNLAMYPHIVFLMNAPYEKAAKEGLSMGITTYPSFKDKPGVGSGLFGGGWAISKQTKHKDLAFQMAMHLASDEVQTELAKIGVVTPLKNPEVQKKLYEGYEFAKGMDLSVIFKTTVAPPYEKTKYDGKAQPIVNSSVQNVFKSGADINTIMREIDEKINKMVEEEKKK